MENEKIIDMKAMHEVQLGNLKELDRVCKKHGIKYYLAFGTLIGAIRDNGIIPWDDDIDVVVTRADYNRLLSIDKSEWNAPYFLQSFETEPDSAITYMKVRNSNTTLIEKHLQKLDINHGISIDIYSMVNVPDNPRDRRKQLKFFKGFMLFTANQPAQNHGLFYRMASGLLLFVIPVGVRKKLRSYCEKKMLKYQNEKTNECIVLAGFNGLKRTIKNEFFNKTLYHKFEDTEFPIPGGYDEWLSTRYGDYMKHPPKEQQKMKVDGFVLVDAEHPYTEYRGKYYFPKKK